MGQNPIDAYAFILSSRGLRYNRAVLKRKSTKTVAFFRQYIAPLIIFAIFLFTLILVSSRAFLPDDMVAPAPIGTLPTGTISIS
jgi:hypothetical protein